MKSNMSSAPWPNQPQTVLMKSYITIVLLPLDFSLLRQLYYHACRSMSIDICSGMIQGKGTKKRTAFAVRLNLFNRLLEPSAYEIFELVELVLGAALILQNGFLDELVQIHGVFSFL